MPNHTRSEHVNVTSPSTQARPWSVFRLPTLVLITLIISAFLHNYITHPGLHVAGATVLLDVVLLRWRRRTQNPIRRARVTRYSFLTVLTVANVLGLAAVLLENDDPFAMTVATMEGCLSVLLLLV